MGRRSGRKKSGCGKPALSSLSSRHVLTETIDSSQRRILTRLPTKVSENIGNYSSYDDQPLMTFRLENQNDLERAIEMLIQQDSRLQPILKQAGMPELRRREPGFAGLAAIIVGQQLSTASAAAIWGRMVAAFDPFLHDALHRARADRLGRLGLSAAKIKTLKVVAKEIIAGRLNLDTLADRGADEAHSVLTSLHGVGPWTADVYLLFCLGHGDAWPAGDLGVQEAIRIGLNLKTRPTTKEMGPLAESWRPLRGAAAHLWWAYNRAVKNRGGAPVVAPADSVANKRQSRISITPAKGKKSR
jgi:DNA-3-methyladenine glycosylase II